MRSVCMCVYANRGLLEGPVRTVCHIGFGGSTAHYQRVGRLITGRPEKITVSAAPCIAAAIVSSFQLLGHERGEAVPLNRKIQSESGYVTKVAQNWVAGNLHRIGGGVCVCVGGGREVNLQEDAACSVCCGLRGAVSRHCNRTLEGWV